MQFTRVRIVLATTIVGILVVAAVLAYIVLLTPATIERPIAPASVAAVMDRWGYDILLPTQMPDCLSYDPSATGIVSDDSAGNGLALQVTLAPVTSGTCTSSDESVVRISEAPTLESLSGDVTTITEGRMQFARVRKSTSEGRTELTLQWHCLRMMCRITSTTGSAVTEDELAKMADSFKLIKPQS